MRVIRLEQGDFREILVELKRSARNSPDSGSQGPIFRALQKGNVFKRDLKVDPLGIKRGPSWRVRLLPLHLRRCPEGLQVHVCESVFSSATSIGGYES